MPGTRIEWAGRRRGNRDFIATWTELSAVRFSGTVLRDGARDEFIDRQHRGWLHTGDIARADERGYMFILDRKLRT